MSTKVCVGLLVVGVILALSQSAFTQVSTTSLNGKVMPGYQGWFYCPSDGTPGPAGWRHWSKSTTTIGEDYYGMDMWPDVLEYASGDLFSTGVTLEDSSTGYLFSSYKSGVTNLHFSWMQKHGIDGVFLQRFVSELSDTNFFSIRNTILTNVKNAASTYGRVFVVEYDVTGTNENTLYDEITEDWEYLIDTVDITSHSRYLYHNSKPVVVIFGLGYLDRPGTYDVWDDIIDYFQNDATYGGNFLIGQVPTGWRTLSGSDIKTNSNWSSTYRSLDGLSTWSVGAYETSSQITTHKNNKWDPDLDECDTYGMEYMPVIWPGFQWDNLMDLTCGTSYFSRRDGQHLWDQAYAVNSLGVDQIFIANFDEYDESTAIMKASSNTPTTDCWNDYGTYPNDWYMRLAGEIGKVLRSEISNTSTIPIDAFALADSEANIDLGTTNSGTDMTLLSGGDADTVATTVGGINCRRTNVASGDYYMYLTVADTFMYQGECPRMYVEIDYYDSGTGTIELQYDSRVSSTTASIHKSGGSVSRGNTNTWKSHTFSITEAYFGNRIGGGADFRIFAGTSNDAYIDIIRVTDRRPVAKMSASPTSGVAPLSVSFGSASSYDPDGSISSRAWDFDNNGTTDSTSSSDTHSYTSSGTYTCKLTVTDNDGLTDSTTTTINVSDAVKAFVNMGSSDITDDLNRPSTEPADGDTTSVNLQGGRGCRTNVNNANDYYIYFQVNDSFAYQGDMSNCWVAFDYYDTGTASLTLQYDATGAAYTSAGSVTLGNTNTWKRKKFQLTDAYFGNRQNYSCDFRIFGGVNTTFYLDCVQVSTSEPSDDPQDGATVSIDMGTTDSADGMTQPQNSDGDTTGATTGGRNCRRNVDSGNDYYFYFAVDDTDFGYQGNKYDVYVKLEYYDVGGGSLTLNYDANTGTTINDKYKGGGSVTVGSTSTWKSYTWHVTDAYLGNRQNASADFRIFLGTGVTRYLDKVTVSTSQP